MVSKKFQPPVALLIIGVSFIAILIVTAVSFRGDKKQAVLIKAPGENISGGIDYTGWQDYFNPNLGLRLLYPPQFKNYQRGILFSKVSSGSKSGAQICINLSGCLPDQPGIFEIRATSTNWVDLKSQPSFLDVQGYINDTGESVEEINLLDGKTAYVFMGSADTVRAVINTGFPDYPAIAAQMQIKSDLSREVFIKLIKSFTFPWQEDFPADSSIRAEATPPRFFDPEIKLQMAAVAKIVNCRYTLSDRYPDTYFPDHACGKSVTVTNGITQKPFHYQPTEDGQNYIIKAKLSSGELYTLTRQTNPPGTPTPASKK